MPAKRLSGMKRTESDSPHLPKTVLVRLSEHDSKRDVLEGLGHEVAQGEGLAGAALAKEADSGVQRKVVNVHLKLADGPDARRDRVDNGKDLAERVGLGDILGIGLFVGPEDFGGAGGAVFRGVIGLGGARDELLARQELGNFGLARLVIFAVILRLLLGSRLFGGFFCSHEQLAICE